MRLSNQSAALVSLLKSIDPGRGSRINAASADSNNKLVWCDRCDADRQGRI